MLRIRTPFAIQAMLANCRRAKERFLVFHTQDPLMTGAAELRRNPGKLLQSKIGQIFPPLKPCLAIFHILDCPLKGLTQFPWIGKKNRIVHRSYFFIPPPLFNMLFCLFDKVAKFLLKNLHNSCGLLYLCT